MHKNETIILRTCLLEKWTPETTIGWPDIVGKRSSMTTSVWKAKFDVNQLQSNMHKSQNYPSIFQIKVEMEYASVVVNHTLVRGHNTIEEFWPGCQGSYGS